MVGTIGNVAALYAPRSSMAPFHNLRGYGTNGRCRVRLCLSKKGTIPRLHLLQRQRIKKPIATKVVRGGTLNAYLEDEIPFIQYFRDTDNAPRTLAHYALELQGGGEVLSSPVFS